jgi:hypothetical protein
MDRSEVRAIVERHIEPLMAKGGYGSQSARHDNPNAKRERIRFSPHCLEGGS